VVPPVRADTQFADMRGAWDELDEPTKTLVRDPTQPRYVYSHDWRVGDLVIWDNRTTMHRGTSFDDSKHRREMRRTTTLDIEHAPTAQVSAAAAPAHTS
jgi:alpha-ketoglutarate-dependent taurine dioxygenase